jgi:GNAT superfamily N-acetyltransferase
VADAENEFTIRPLGRPGDLGWVVMAHGELYAAEFGWDSRLEEFILQIVADYATEHDPERERAWIAERDGLRVGCIFCVADPDDRTTAKLRTLLVAQAGRGHGLGGQLLDAALAFARAGAYERARLWTNHPLAAARHLYLQRGFELIEEEPHHSFGVDLIGQVYELPLAARSTRA